MPDARLMDYTGKCRHVVRATHNSAGSQCISTETTVDGIATCSGIESATFFHRLNARTPDNFITLLLRGGQAWNPFVGTTPCWSFGA